MMAKLKAKYEKLKVQLEHEFPGELQITGEGTPASTGWFEVQIVGAKLLHSKKNGDGYVNTKPKYQRICDGIGNALGH